MISDIVDEDIDAVSDPFDVVDVSQWPTVEIRVLRAPIDNGEIDEFQDRFLEVLRLAEFGTARVPPAKVFLLFNLDGIVKASVAQQLRAGPFIKNVRNAAEKTIHATALVATSAMARGILSFVLGLQPLVSVNKVFSSNEDARVWLAGNKDRVSRGLPVAS